MSGTHLKASGALLPVAFGTSEAIPPTHPTQSVSVSEEPNQPGRWHPRVTPYRLLVTGLIAGLGTAKALASNSGKGLDASVTIEWILGIVVLILTFFLGRYEVKEAAKPAWLFKLDIIDQIRSLGVNVPVYHTAERPIELVDKHKRPPVTGYRILVSVAAISFGVIKATLSYTGHDTAPKAVEWVYGVVLTLCLYWLGMYENGFTEPPIMPWLFVRDYGKQVYPPCFVVGFIAVHLATAWATHSFSNFCFSHAEEAFQQNPPFSAGNDVFGELSVYGFIICFIAFGVGLGVVGSCVAIASLGLRLLEWLLGLALICLEALKARLSTPSTLNGLDGEDAGRGYGHFEVRVPRNLWTLSPFSTAPSRMWVKLLRVLAGLSIVGIIAFYLIVHDVGTTVRVLTSVWTFLWFLLLWILWPHFLAPEGIGEELGYILFTILFTHVGYVPALLMVLLPFYLVLFLYTKCFW